MSGHVKRVKRKCGDQFYLKYRAPSGKQIETKLGPVWSERSRPPAGHYTLKMAEAALAELLTDLRRGTVPDPGDRSGKTFGDAVAEWLRHARDERDLQESTLRDYRNEGGKLEEEFGAETPAEKVTQDKIEDWRQRELSAGGLSRRTLQKRLVLLGGIMRRAKRIGWVPSDPTADIDPITVKSSGEFNVLSVDQVEAVARAAESDLYRVAIVVAAYTGLRTGEVRALRWRDVDFTNAAIRVTRNMPAGGVEGPPKGGKVRSVPMIDDATVALDGLSKRESFTSPDDRVFPNEAGEMLAEDNLRDALYEAMEAAGIDRKAFPAKDGFVFHDLRHTFGTLAVQVFPLTDVKAYMGHADIATTMRYVHHVPQTDAAQRFTEAIQKAKGEMSPEPSPELPRTERNSAQL